MKNSFAAGDVYFRVKYAEPARKYPLIESFVFVGNNLSDEDTEDTWYFQFGDSFAKYGSILESSGGDRRVVCLTANELEDMLDGKRLLKELVRPGAGAFLIHQVEGSGGRRNGTENAWTVCPQF